MRKYGESVYGTSGGPIRPGEWGACTHKDNAIYLHVLDWSKSPALVHVPGQVASASVLGGGPVTVLQTEVGTISIKVAEADRTEPVTVVKLVMEK